MEAVLRKARKFNYYGSTQENFDQIILSRDYALFRSLIDDPHGPHPLLPPLKQTSYNLRKRSHDYCLINKDDRNVVNRALFQFI